MTVSPGATGTLLTLELSGLRPGTLYAAWLHSGTCAQPSASAGHLVTESATARGDWGATAKSVHTAAGTLVALTPDLLGSGDQLVAVRDPTGTVIACGEIPKGAR